MRPRSYSRPRGLRCQIKTYANARNLQCELVKHNTYNRPRTRISWSLLEITAGPRCGKVTARNTIIVGIFSIDLNFDRSNFNMQRGNRGTDEEHFVFATRSGAAEGSKNQ